MVQKLVHEKISSNHKRKWKIHSAETPRTLIACSFLCQHAITENQHRTCATYGRMKSMHEYCWSAVSLFYCVAGMCVCHDVCHESSERLYMTNGLYRKQTSQLFRRHGLSRLPLLCYMVFCVIMWHFTPCVAGVNSYGFEKNYDTHVNQGHNTEQVICACNLHKLQEWTYVMCL